MFRRMLWNRLAIACAGLLAVGVVLTGCGSDSVSAPDPEASVSETYVIDRPRLETIDGTCPGGHGFFAGEFDQNGAELVFNARYNGNPQFPLRWVGTIDGAMNFSLELVGDPFSLVYEAWTAEGSFSADRSTLNGTEYFRGTLSNGDFCEGIVGWVGRRR